ncbi:choice-of-anchor Q domain-containing protein [Bacteroidota bacterium]
MKALITSVDQRLFLVLIALNLTCIPLKAQTSFEVSDTIWSNTTWDVDTVRVTGDIFIADEVILTIEPGTRVEFQGHYGIKVFGVLLAEGLPGDSIIFTIYDTTGYAGPEQDSGAWAGILFDDAYSSGAADQMEDNDSSIISVCRIEYVKVSKYGAVSLRMWSLLRLLRSRIQYCTSYSHAGGLYLQKANIIVSNNVFAHNQGANGGGINCREFNGMILNNLIHSNTAVNGGGIILTGSGYPEINNNIIANNYADWGGGILTDEVDPVFKNNLIVNNSSFGGGGLELRVSNATIVNNTISNNKSNATSGGIHSSGSSLNLVNTILWGNEGPEGPQFFVEWTSISNFYHCLVQDGFNGINNGDLFEGEYLNNIESEPGFVDASIGAGQAFHNGDADWSLVDTSSCFNQGSPEDFFIELPAIDITGDTRIHNNRVDIGAYEYHLASINVCDTIKNPTTWKADTVKITCNVVISDSVTLTIDHGTVVEFQGHYIIKVSGIIKALGASGDSILFTINDTSGFADRSVDSGGWSGFKIRTASENPDTSIFDHCIFEYGKNTNRSGGVMFIGNTSKIRITNCDIRNNYANESAGGIFTASSKTAIKNCVLRNNFSPEGGGLTLYRIFNIDFSDNYFEGNNAEYGGALFVIESDITLANSTFYRNSSNYGGAVYLSYSKTIMPKCQFFNNKAIEEGGAIHIVEADYKTKLLNSIIANNTAIEGGAISGGGPLIINSTIANNSSGYYTQTENPRLINTILWNNGDYEMKLVREWAEPQFHNCIIMGDSAAFILEPGTIYDGNSFSDNLDTIPEFVKTSQGVGIVYDGMSADWSVSPFSPCINQGTMEVELMDDSDLLGNPRINDRTIDIGAIENQAGIPDIVIQPANQYACIGEKIEFSLQASDTARYQWQKNDLDIPGETNSRMVIDSVSFDDEASYNCLINNNYGSKSSNIVLLIVRSKPQLVNQLNDSWITNTGTTRLEARSTGTQPISYQWMKDGTIIPDTDNELYEIANDNPDNEGTYLCRLSNLCGETHSDSIKIYRAPQICMVTVSTATGHNLVVWEKKTTAPIMAYNIYRESQSAGIYDILGTVSFDELSVFVDTTADPTVQAYLYKITAIDTAENETDADLSKVHKTVHLLVSTNPELNTTQLEWDRYFGFAYNTYSIYKSTTGVNFDLAYSLSASLNSWTDPEPSSGDLFYRIAVEKPDPCVPEGTGKKAGTGPYQHSLSNMDDNKLKAGQLPPDTIILNNNSILEENLPGTMIGKLSTQDPDTVDSHTYQFVTGEGDDDNISFTLLGDLLLTSETFNYNTKNQYLIRIRSTDQSGGYCEVPFVIQILTATGLQDMDAGAVKAFPNPFSQATTITFHNPSGTLYKLMLRDLSGKLVRMVEVRSDQFVLERENLGKGMYMIELKGDRTYRGKLVIE